jgi:hypothetical protein
MHPALCAFSTRLLPWKPGYFKEKAGFQGRNWLAGRRSILLTTLSLISILASSCSNKPRLVRVQGKVIFKEAPLTGGSIWFQPDSTKGNTAGEKASCQLALDGSFEMRTYPYGGGVRPGAYKVTLAPELANRIGAPKHAQPHTTPIEIVVPDEGMSDLVITIKPEGKPKNRQQKQAGA